MRADSLTFAAIAVLVICEPAMLARQVEGAPVGVVVPGCDATVRLPDDDDDGLSTPCEESLASTFAPELLVDPADCLWGKASDDRLAGAYLYAAQPLSATGDTVRLAYIPGYFRDCGWRGLQRLLRFGRANAHAGDSELILLDVRRDAAGAWRTVAVFLSAHCFSRSDGRCRWFRGEELNELAWASHRFGAPRVWVARDKHANYPSRARCESGYWHQDACGSAPRRYRFPVTRAGQNVGRREHSRFGRDGCVRSEDLPLPMSGAAPGTRECVWSNETLFRGWQRDHPGSATPYGLLLSRIGGL